MLTGSWIICDKRTNKAVLEIYNGELINQLNTERYEAFTAYDCLCSLNAKIKLGGDTPC